MALKKEKTGLLISAIWLLLAVPISEDLYDEALDSGLFMRIFALALVGLPVWLVFGWRWFTDKAPINAKFWIPVAIVGLALAFLMVTSFFGRNWDSVSYIPLFSVAPFLILTWVFEREAMMFWRKKASQKVFSTHLMPTKADLERDVGNLLQTADSIATTVHDEYKRLSNWSKLPAIINPQAHAIIAAYALIHLHFRHLGFPEGSKAIMIFAAFRSQMLTNYIVMALPKIPGLPKIEPEVVRDKELRAAGLGTLKLYEDLGATVQSNLDRNAPYPFYPFYENNRPYLGAHATAMELNQTFDSLYASLSGKAQRSVEGILRKQTAAGSR